MDLDVKWHLLEIMTDIGTSENTIKDILVKLRVENSDRPPANRFSDDDIAKKLLSMIAHGSNTFAVTVTKELNAAEGVPGQPGVREYQLAAPAMGGPRPRDLNSIVNFYHQQWRAAVKRGAIPIAAATGSQVPREGKHEIEAGRAATERGISATPAVVAPWGRNSTIALAPPRELSMSYPMWVSRSQEAP